jgi:plastocyanin domain-containing protein
MKQTVKRKEIVMVNFTTKILNKRHNVKEYVFNNVTQVVAHMNNAAFNDMTSGEFNRMTDVLKVSGICNSGRTICGTLK